MNEDSIEEIDKNTNLLSRYTQADGGFYKKARYYDPIIGRFLGEDSLGFGGGDDSFYAYVFGDPANLADRLNCKY